MKLIEAMKEVKDQEEKITDLISKISRYCADQSHETPVYGTIPAQTAKVAEWLQSIHDTSLRCVDLRVKIQKTNLQTMVSIELGGNKVTKSIAEWILRRRTYSVLEHRAWISLTDKNLKEGQMTNSAGEKVAVTVRRYFDPVTRDRKVEEFRSEPSIIDRTLEVINATTDLVE